MAFEADKRDPFACEGCGAIDLVTKHYLLANGQRVAPGLAQSHRALHLCDDCRRVNVELLRAAAVVRELVVTANGEPLPRN